MQVESEPNDVIHDIETSIDSVIAIVKIWHKGHIKVVVKFKKPPHWFLTMLDGYISSRRCVVYFPNDVRWKAWTAPPNKSFSRSRRTEMNVNIFNIMNDCVREIFT